ncbi:choice-of-anchor D domain-containing protein [Seonamhaeicola maritimus]|uniref:Choice-of-anchor D domain-containing protein n=1 Tax=Seonamhaeicola maritimus TaxID=2591822 RepID=A0A5C7GDC5_9FLAO|nr:choice-of-anchor D domain-containing protein [Seonamhaeicola maritimus]TXG34496.1 choice-of-anchor D domain-containing protein [Seonamhaeicola maritimus]
MKNYTLVIFVLLLCIASNNSFAQGTLEVIGNSTLISNGDTTPTVSDDTDFGSIVVGNSNANSFQLDNITNGNSSKDLNNVTVTISGSSDFTPTTSTNYGSIAGNNSSVFHTITFTPSSVGLKTATVTVTFDNGTNSPYTFTIQGTGYQLYPEIDVLGNGNSIAGDNTNTPALSDDTDFDDVYVGIGSSETYTIDNSAGLADLSVTSIVLSDATNYAVSGITLPATVSAGGSTTFTVTINAGSTGIKNSTVTINNDDADEGTYVYNITANALTPQPEIDVRGLGNSIVGDGTNTPLISDDTNFGSTGVSVGSVTHTFTIHNTGPIDLTLDDPSPYITIGGTHSADFTLDITGISQTISGGSSTTFDITFDPTALGTRTATVSIANNDTTGSEDPYIFNIQGTGANSTFTEVSVYVNWPSRSQQNRVEIYSPSDELILTIDNGFTGNGNAPYSTTVDLSCVEDLSNYYYIMYDTNSNGWDGTDNIRIYPTGGGADFVNTNGDSATLAGVTGYFNVSGATCGAEIDVKGNLQSIIGDGTNTPSIFDHTHFGDVQIVSETAVRTFYLQNIGGSDLNVSSISLTGSTKFSLQSAPTTPLVLGVFGSEAIQIAYSTTTETLDTATLTILSTGDSGEETYTINLSAQGSLIFFDSDNDGVYDDADDDDDNDGITDSDEENNCRLAGFASTTDYKFLNETFGTGTTRSTAISTLYTATTNYCIEDGDSGTSSPCDSSFDSTNLQDGEYTVASFLTTGVNGETIGPSGDSVAAWAWYAWGTIEDHTPGDTDGRMAIFNASYAPGVFYETEIKGTLANVPVTYSFWVVNIDNADDRFIAQEGAGSVPRIQPNVTVNFYTSDRSTLIATFDTGDITRCSGAINDPNDPAYDPSDPSFNTCVTSEWKQFSQQLTTSETSFIVQFVNNAPGGGGNDLAIDDIVISQTLCDLDSDSIADVFDLDSDNDGIPDVVEAGFASVSEGEAQLTSVAAWTDSNGNGMYDSADGISPLDSDGDGVPNYIDLDSDNDGIFDVDELGVTNSNDALFQNGDGDINGDGVGDGLETETFREKDSDGDGTNEGYGDGILDIYDFYENNTSYGDSYGNDSQGTGPLYALDTDGDGTPDYLDITSDGSTFDIDGTLYASLDADNDGIIDGGTDSERDGILDAFDTDDTAFGSPRDLDRKLHLFFDGRNDYGEDTNVISSGPATMMAFIRSNGANTNGDDRIIMGQDDFYLRINNSDNTVSAIIEGTTLTSSTAITNGRWTHIAVTTESGNSVLYINGISEDTDSSGGITSASNLMIGRSSANDKHYHGYIDELRVFDKALTADELRKMIYQELEDNGSARGAVIPLDITDYDSGTDTATALPWSNMRRYFRMDAYKDDIIDDYATSGIDVGTGAKIYNTKIIDVQSAPVPFVTQQSGSLATALDIPAHGVHGNDAVNYDWSIIKISHDDVTYNVDQKHVGVIVDELDGSSNPIEFSIQNDTELNVSWYLELNGFIDLDGESQLVQGPDSSLSVGTNGQLEGDQQGTRDLFTYNYWCSPVGVADPPADSNPNPTRFGFTLQDILNDGAIDTNPLAITFLGSGYNGSPGTPGSVAASIADYWVWKYANRVGNTYSQWQHMRSTGTIYAGEGFTMKGIENTSGSIGLEHNYVFNGKPNNGDITLSIASGNDYLVGNPYPSALDADEFILDNIADGSGRNSVNVINGALYFWEHFASNSHVLAEYQGGYGMYTLMGGTQAINNDTRINHLGVLTATKTPKRYIPVGQGFFVFARNTGESNTVNPVGGTITFKNSQRIFQKESGGSSTFMKSADTKSKTTSSKSEIDERQKIRLMFDSPKGFHRQLLVGVDQNASSDFDPGYDADLFETNKEDMFWNLNGGKLVIQAVDNFDNQQILPLGIKTNIDGLSTIKIDGLENIDINTNVFVHDKELDVYQNLKEGNYEVFLTAGEHLNRFEITFENASQPSLSAEDLENKNLNTYFSNEKQSFVLHNPDLKDIKSMEVYNILGQSVYVFEKIKSENYQEFKTRNINPGTYIIKVNTIDGTLSKKVLVQ